MKDDLENDFMKLAATFFKEAEEDFGKYKALKTSDISSIPDEELEDAVMDWMWSKVEEDFNNYEGIIERLPEACQVIYACRTVRDEVNNGGFIQGFFNGKGRFVEMAQIGFYKLGLKNLSEIMTEVITIYNKNVKHLREYDNGTLEGLEKAYEDDLFDRLDEKFYTQCEESDLEKRMLEYIRDNVTSFGD